MKIVLENFGIIKRFEFDTEDNFTFIIGGNNTGKSYAMTAVYLIIKNLPYLIKDFDSKFINKFISPIRSPEEQEYLEDALENDDSILSFKSLDIEDKLNDGAFIKNLNNSFRNSFDSIENLQNQFVNNNLEITITTYYFIFHIKIDKNTFYISTIDDGSENVTNRFYEIDTDVVLNYVDGIQNIDISNQYSEENRELIYQLSIESLQKEIFSEFKNLEKIYYLPASRSGIYQSMNAFGQIFAELTQKRSDISHDIKVPAMSIAISDYYIKLVSINENNRNDDSEIGKIASKIEKILNGKINFNEETKKLSFSPNHTDLDLALAFTSSMVSEITPIVAYLRYIIKEEKNPIIMIEEPEAHLHPSIQIKLLKHFVELSKHNIKIIITTHSDYMFDQFNNLILSKNINIDKVNCLFFKELDKGTDVIKMKIDELGIEDENFIYTSEKLYNEKLSIIEKLNEYEDEE